MNGKLLKRLILSLLTFVAIARIFLSLGESLNEPQVQSRLELYQANLVLHAAELEVLDDNGQSNSSSAFIGNQPYETAEQQYQNAKEAAADNLVKLNQLSLSTNSTSQQGQLAAAIAKENNFIDELDLKLGIIQASEGNTKTAIDTWNKLIEKQTELSIVQTADLLKNLWSRSPDLASDLPSQVTTVLNGWFTYAVSKQFYQLQNNFDALSTLQAQEQEIASSAFLKLALVSGLPALIGITGFIFLIFLLGQLFLQKEKAILVVNNTLAWETPWDWEIVWQVLIVGFFFVAQIVLPFLIGISGLNVAEYSIRYQALYILITYLLMAAGGLSVLYFSIKSFLPLPKDWFQFKFASNWVLWGLGGYFVAVPLVILISLINQQIWQGQGGSNPLLFLALQAQDRVALAIFFFTACIAAPIFEEIIFRGFLLSSLTRYLPVWGAIFLSSLIFALAHLSLSEVLPLTMLAIVLGVVYTRSRNLLASMLLHSLYNSGTLLSLYILGSGVN